MNTNSSTAAELQGAEATKPSQTWLCGNYRVLLSHPVIMAIINLTPDSFSGDGCYKSVGAVMRRAEQALSEGASILDVGGESTRPGSLAISVEEELARVIPAVRALTSFNVPISVDTLKPEVMEEAIAAGASIVNDINALREPNALHVIAQSNAGVCLMHMKGSPRDMQVKPGYADVVTEVHSFLEQRLKAVIASGIAAGRVTLDPGFGFGKTLNHNQALFRALLLLREFGQSVLVGVSRKTMLGEITSKSVDNRVVATAAASLLAAQHGASIFRVHDVAATRDALQVWQSLQ